MDLYELVRHAIEVGVMSRRGGHFYFRGKYLGNGNPTLQLNRNPDLVTQLRAEISKAERAAMECARHEVRELNRLYELGDQAMDK